MKLFKISEYLPINGPTYINESGTLIWVNSNDETHREKGPAIINPNGVLEYWRHGVQERIICPDGLRIKNIPDKNNKEMFEVEKSSKTSHETVEVDDFIKEHKLGVVREPEYLNGKLRERETPDRGHSYERPTDKEFSE